MPRELEPLYSHLLGHIEPLYLQWVSKALQILRNNHDLGHDPFGKESSAREGVVPLTVQSFFFAIEPAMQNCTQAWLDARCEDVSLRLTAQCAGLLDISNTMPYLGGHFSGVPSLIRYFHRTAKDFLEQETHWCKILMQTANMDFNPNVCMMRSCLRSIQFAIANNLLYNPALSRDFLVYSYHADSDYQSHETQVFLLDKFNDTVNDTMNISRNSWWGVDFQPGVKGSPDFLKVATIYGLRGYVTAKFSGSSRENDEATALLRRLIPDDDFQANSKLPLPKVEMVSLLLDLGADPMEPRELTRVLGALGKILLPFSITAPLIQAGAMISRLSS